MNPSCPDPELIEQVILDLVRGHTLITGQISLPCLPFAIDQHLQLLENLFSTIGSSLSGEELQRLRETMLSLMQQGFRTSPTSKLLVQYHPDPENPARLACQITVSKSTMVDTYEDWLKEREGPLFGSQPDAKVIEVASTLGTPDTVPVLDVGAGVGRNSLPLAKLGHPVDAVEPVAGFVEQMTQQATQAGASLRIFSADILDPMTRFRPAYYKLAIACEVVASHFRNPDEVRLLLAKLCDFVRSGGMILLSAFLAVEGYEPDVRLRQLSQFCWSYLLTRPELQTALEDLPLELISDESVHDYEQAHLPPEAWPPTPWFINWSKGRNLYKGFEQPPMELRWLLFRRL